MYSYNSIVALSHKSVVNNKKNTQSLNIPEYVDCR